MVLPTLPPFLTSLSLSLLAFSSSQDAERLNVELYDVKRERDDFKLRLEAGAADGGGLGADFSKESEAFETEIGEISVSLTKARDEARSHEVRRGLESERATS